MKNLDIQEKEENFCPSKEKLKNYIEKIKINHSNLKSSSLESTSCTKKTCKAKKN